MELLRRVTASLNRFVLKQHNNRLAMIARVKRRRRPLALPGSL